MSKINLFLYTLVLTIVSTALVTWVHLEAYIYLVKWQFIPAQLGGDYVSLLIKDLPFPLWFPIVYWNALMEELIFRFVPLVVTTFVFSKQGKYLPLVVIVSSLVFGLAHDLSIAGVLLHGVSGVIYCLLFIIVNRQKDIKSAEKAMMTTALCHALFNMIAYYVS